MVSKGVISPIYKWDIRVIAHILTFDPNFRPGTSKCYQAGNCYDFHTTPWVPCNVIPGAQAGADGLGKWGGEANKKCW